MVYVTHDGNDRAARLHIFVTDHFVRIDFLHHMSSHVLRLEAKLLRYEVDSLRVKTLVDRNEEAERHTGTDDLIDRHVHHHSQVVGSHELGEFEDLGLLLSLHDLEFI